MIRIASFSHYPNRLEPVDNPSLRQMLSVRVPYSQELEFSDRPPEICISKSRHYLVTDTRGRVLSWSAAENRGGGIG